MLFQAGFLFMILTPFLFMGFGLGANIHETNYTSSVTENLKVEKEGSAGTEPTKYNGSDAATSPKMVNLKGDDNVDNEYSTVSSDSDNSTLRPDEQGVKPKMNQSSDPTLEEQEYINRRLAEEVEKHENVETPDKETLEKWGFFVVKTMGELDEYRDYLYNDQLKQFDTVDLPDLYKMPENVKEKLNSELEAVLNEDHYYQLFSAKLYREARAEALRRKKRETNIEDKDFDFDYDSMKNPYYRKRFQFFS